MRTVHNPDSRRYGLSNSEIVVDGESKNAVLSVVEHVLQEGSSRGGMVLMHDLSRQLQRARSV